MELLPPRGLEPLLVQVHADAWEIEWALCASAGPGPASQAAVDAAGADCCPPARREAMLRLMSDLGAATDAGEPTAAMIPSRADTAQHRDRASQ